LVSVVLSVSTCVYISKDRSYSNEERGEGRTVSYKATEVPTNDAVPGRAFPLVKLDECQNDISDCVSVSTS